MIFKSIIYGSLAAMILLIIYFSVVSLISGWWFALSQFNRFWYFIVGLAIGFGIQIGLYAYLKTFLRQKNNTGKVLAVSGATSTAAMLSCCAHYLANILPIIGVSGIVGLAGQYQIELFWLGLVLNIFGIIYIVRKIIIVRRL